MCDLPIADNLEVPPACIGRQAAIDAVIAVVALVIAPPILV